jgi:2-aminoadipate transaminase
MIIDLDRSGEEPLYLQIFNNIRLQIERGLLPPESRLPATRELARSLGVSRNTVVLAYQELEVRGLITSRVGRGAFVCRHLPPGISAAPAGSQQKMLFEGLFSSGWMKSFSTRLPARDNLSAGEGDREAINLASALPDKELFPIAEFRDCLYQAMRRYGSDLLTCGPPQGFQPFLDYLPVLLAQRSIYCRACNLMVVNGIQQALSLVGRLFLDPGDTVVLENLTYPGALSVFRSFQATCIGIPVDSQGMRVDVLETVLRRSNPKLIYTIPTFQNPTGTCLSPERRRVLVELCREREIVIVEDDYAHELAFDGRGLAPLKAWDEAEGIIYLGSFSEILFPGIRLSFILAPAAIIDRLLLVKESSDLYTNRILQGALLEFCRRGFLSKHIKKKRLVHRKRSMAMAGALRDQLPEEVSWRRPSGGLFQWVELPAHIDALALLAKCRERKLLFAPDRLFFAEAWERGGFRLGFADVPEQEIVRGVSIIAGALREMTAESAGR